MRDRLLLPPMSQIFADAIGVLVPVRPLNQSAQICAICGAILASLAAPLPAAGQSTVDRVRTVRGSEAGEVVEMTPLEVTLNRGTVGQRSIAVNDIRTIVFHGEPVELTQARVHVANGGYRSALESLEQIDVGAISRDFVRQDVEFYRALSQAQLALAGGDGVVEAGRELNRFVRSYPQSFHYLAAAELMGDLLVASERYDAAERQYAELAKAPWPEYKMRATVAVARSLQAQEKHADAVEQFDAALAMNDGSDTLEIQALTATLGKAVSLAATGDVERAARMIEDVIASAGPEEKELHARAYNALGHCYQRAGKTKDALLAFLHVDLLYNTVPELHAEALAQLAQLWRTIGQEERAREARQVLEERYAGSRWAQ